MNKKPQFISPAEILAGLHLKPGMKVIDYASGAGHWTIAAAKLVAPNGKVLAIENDINMLQLVQSKAETEKIGNIEIEELELENGTSKLATPADLVIVSNIMYLIEDKQGFAKRACVMVSPTGRLVFVDWLPQKTLFGPPVELRVKEEDMITLFEKNGLQMACSVKAGVDHFGLVFKRKEIKNEG